MHATHMHAHTHTHANAHTHAHVHANEDRHVKRAEGKTPPRFCVAIGDNRGLAKERERRGMRGGESISLNIIKRGLTRSKY